MAMFNDAEYDILRQYKKLKTVVPEHLNTLEKMASMNFCTFGFVTVNGAPVETAWLTEPGKRWIRRERIYRNPVLRFLYSNANDITP